MTEFLHGYLDELSYRTGQEVTARVSGVGDAIARLVALRKSGPDACEGVVLAGAYEKAVSLRRQHLPAGSGFPSPYPPT